MPPTVSSYAYTLYVVVTTNMISVFVVLFYPFEYFYHSSTVSIHCTMVHTTLHV